MALIVSLYAVILKECNSQDPYHFIFDGSILRNWYEAQAYCNITFGTNLATIETVEKSEIAMQIMITDEGNPSLPSWIGLNDINTEGEWGWISNAPCDPLANGSLCVTYWKDGEPNDLQANGGEDCVDIIRDAANKPMAYDGPCSIYRRNQFFCDAAEFAPTVSPTTLPSKSSLEQIIIETTNANTTEIPSITGTTSDTIIAICCAIGICIILMISLFMYKRMKCIKESKGHDQCRESKNDEAGTLTKGDDSNVVTNGSNNQNWMRMISASMNTPEVDNEERCDYANNEEMYGDHHRTEDVRNIDGENQITTDALRTSGCDTNMMNQETSTGADV